MYLKIDDTVQYGSDSLCQQTSKGNDPSIQHCPFLSSLEAISSINHPITLILPYIDWYFNSFDYFWHKRNFFCCVTVAYIFPMLFKCVSLWQRGVSLWKAVCHHDTINVFHIIIYLWPEWTYFLKTSRNTYHCF